MKQLLIRNFKCRSITIAIYILLLLLNPLYAFVFSKTELYFLFYAPIAITLMAVSILDSGHLFRLHRRLGGKSSYLFYESLPVSKKTCLMRITLPYRINTFWWFYYRFVQFSIF